MTKLPIEIVKRKLWRFNYSVRDYSEIAAIKFDLLVTCDEYANRVIVMTKKPESMPQQCEVLALVEKRKVTFIIKSKGKFVEFKSPYKVFGKPKVEHLQTK